MGPTTILRALLSIPIWSHLISERAFSSFGLHRSVSFFAHKVQIPRFFPQVPFASIVLCSFSFLFCRLMTPLSLSLLFVFVVNQTLLSSFVHSHRYSKQLDRLTTGRSRSGSSPTSLRHQRSASLPVSIRGPTAERASSIRFPPLLHRFTLSKQDRLD